MKYIWMFCLALFSGSLFAQEAAEVDPFDLSSSESKVQKLGLVTQPGVEALEQKAKELFNSGQCAEAIPVLEEYAEKANWLGNMISASLDPYYNASYDDRDDFPLGFKQ